MQIKNLANTDIATIVDSMANSFQNYFVKIPFDVDFWAKRYKAARVDYELSFGAFDGDKLVAFIIQGVDLHNGEKTAFNTGTGVIEEYRGQKLVDQLYDFAFPALKNNGITKCLLEVIVQNHRAVRVYERIGFEKDRFLRCFSGELEETNIELQVRETDIEALKSTMDQYQKYYSWDNSLDAIQKGGAMFKSFKVSDKEGIDLGYFTISTANNSLIQVETYQNINWPLMIAATKNTISPLRINNVDDNRVKLINALNNAGLQNHINQFEMKLSI